MTLGREINLTDMIRGEIPYPTIRLHVGKNIPPDIQERMKKGETAYLVEKELLIFWADGKYREKSLKKALADGDINL
jgi:hypothetical protein